MQKLLPIFLSLSLLAGCVPSDGKEGLDLDAPSSVASPVSRTSSASSMERLEPSDSWPVLETPRFRYFLVYGNELGETSPAKQWDASIVREAKDAGDQEVLLPSIKELLPELGEPWNRSLWLFAVPSDERIILQAVLMETDAGGGALYAFDVPAKSLVKMKVNDVYDGFYAGEAMAPDGKRLVNVPDVPGEENGELKTMYLIDLERDAAEVLVRLSGSETFNAGMYALSSHYDISWADAETISYAVYDQAKKKEVFARIPEYEDAAKKEVLIEYRTVRIPE